MVEEAGRVRPARRPGKRNAICDQYAYSDKLLPVCRDGGSLDSVKSYCSYWVLLSGLTRQTTQAVSPSSSGPVAFLNIIKPR